ncbi:MAG: hypothetical protein MRY83_14170 [Flavobacteriales bacterium]|nr:hypothetical protein [Flavobacteriales bacterium]
MNLNYLYLILLFSFSTAFGQSDFKSNVLYPKNPNTCKSCKQAWASTPKEVELSFYVDEKKEIFFTCTDERVLEKLFPSKFFTLSGEIFSSRSFACESKPLNPSKLNGFVLRPLTLVQMKSKKVNSPKGTFICSFGKLPSKFPDPKDVEINLLALKNNALCHYQTNVNVNTDKWDLLDMGLFMKELVLKDDFNTKKTKNLFDYKYSRLSFSIPFDQNAAEISEEQLDVIFDSLDLNSYDLSKATIRAYSSVEGDLATNLKLQNQRAKVISSYMKQKFGDIDVDVNANENWMEFYSDIEKNEEFKYFRTLKRDAVKLRLRDETLAEKMEPILSNHRKVIVIMDVNTKFDDLEDFDQGVSDLQASLDAKDLDKAQEIQLSLLEKIRSNQVPKSFIDKIEIPNAADYKNLQRNLLVFKYFSNMSDLLTSLKDFEAVYDLDKDDKVLYNMVVLKLFLWQINLDKYEAYPQIEKDIEAISSIDPTLINRLKINYNILLAELHSIKKEYSKKDQAVDKVYSYYKQVNSQEQLVKLSRYFANYSQYGRAEYVLQNKLMDLAVDDDLLFYYIELTLHKDYLKKKKEYKGYINHALLLDQNRYCQFFQSKDNGGVSFQLLKNETLKSVYCDKCNLFN